MTALLQIQNLSKAFGQLQAVDQVSLTVPAGKIIGLIGPNGSGKSTLLNLISATTPPDSGKIIFANEDITQFKADAVFQRGIVRSYQDPSLFFRISVLDNGLLPIKAQRGERPWLAPFHRLWRKQEVENAGRTGALLEQVQLRDHYAKSAAELSGGQMKLLELGRSLMGEPQLLLLDEPTAGVAPNLAYAIFEQIEAMRQERGLTFLIIEHRLEVLFDFVDWLYVLHLGQVIAEGTPTEIAANQTVQDVYFGV
ncbi:MAG: ABC transporter ATP-binding protein [Chloroflexota bacterium]